MVCTMSSPGTVQLLWSECMEKAETHRPWSSLTRKFIYKHCIHNVHTYVYNTLYLSVLYNTYFIAVQGGE